MCLYQIEGTRFMGGDGIEEANCNMVYMISMIRERYDYRSCDLAVGAARFREGVMYSATSIPLDWNVVLSISRVDGIEFEWPLSNE